MNNDNHRLPEKPIRLVGVPTEIAEDLIARVAIDSELAKMMSSRQLGAIVENNHLAHIVHARTRT
jgi:hypothetical protein